MTKPRPDSALHVGSRLSPINRRDQRDCTPDPSACAVSAPNEVQTYTLPCAMGGHSPMAIPCLG